MTGKILLELPEEIYQKIQAHLLPKEDFREQGAFVFANLTDSGNNIIFKFADWQPLSSLDFVCQDNDYLELSDHTRASIIKKAHDIGSSLVELHSHPFSKSAMFSFSDCRGFEEFVPHVWWRLQGKPYLAVVVAQKSFDSLVWLDNPLKPQKLDGIITGKHLLQPTGHSIQYLEDFYGRSLR